MRCRITATPLAPTRDRLIATGARVFLPTEVITMLSLVLYELGTNALKYGAWSAPQGVVSIGWLARDGAPIDFLVFKGMDAQSIEEVIFVEVKSGSARLNHNEHSLKDAIINKRIRWYEYHVPAPLTHTSDPATEPAL